MCDSNLENSQYLFHNKILMNLLSLFVFYVILIHMFEGNCCFLQFKAEEEIGIWCIFQIQLPLCCPSL